MARYSLEISRTAEKQLRKLSAADRRRVARAMLALGEEPYPAGARKLIGYDDVFRIRVGVYRIIYSVSGRALVIIILKIGHRKDVLSMRSQTVAGTRRRSVAGSTPRAGRPRAKGRVRLGATHPEGRRASVFQDGPARSAAEPTLQRRDMERR
ncbi:MAG TPA: type II toxin-antitoxin system RelE/ParE family toxin [Gemmatimonadales bacterium]|nr:type II toxin-antitoxin system RelE/ParE family toxin [Gemmatimonadales bacterium]